MLVNGSGDPRELADCENPENGRKPNQRDKEKCDIDRALDHALEQTFPASDPLSTVPGPCDDEEELPAA